ncbi:hypothetical protein E2C01_049369 [Portunus trituberculatus]|uniref:Uncharacterized protein n=1 Tax=Portunus trituberculatus TaxID=210409 RepID=A0A5B7GFV8_PORTR|nr:hypothetical protein [Portunus trituberculatus]
MSACSSFKYLQQSEEKPNFEYLPLTGLAPICQSPYGPGSVLPITDPLMVPLRELPYATVLTGSQLRTNSDPTLNGQKIRKVQVLERNKVHGVGSKKLCPQSEQKQSLDTSEHISGRHHVPHLIRRGHGYCARRLRHPSCSPSRDSLYKNS